MRFCSNQRRICNYWWKRYSVLRILKRKEHKDTQIFDYDPEYIHDEARINTDIGRVMLFSFKDFRLYDINGILLCETIIPDSEKVYDQQYSKKSGNLAIIYKDALRIYSGEDGTLLFEKINLQSTFYAPYGISILEQNGSLSVIDLDTLEVLSEFQSGGTFAAFCGMVVDTDFLDSRELIGATKNGDNYLFIISDGMTGVLYNNKGESLFDVSTGAQSEAFFTENEVIISPQHGTPAAYSLKTGKKIRDLEKDAYLTYVTQMGEYVVSEYITMNAERFAILLDGTNLQSLAYLPQLTDISGDKLLFNYRMGVLRESRIYSIDELKNIAIGGGF